MQESDMVIVAGYGVGSAENFKKIERLAVKMGAAIGATRKVVDEGWAPFDIQVGAGPENHCAGIVYWIWRIRRVAAYHRASKCEIRGGGKQRPGGLYLPCATRRSWATAWI